MEKEKFKITVEQLIEKKAEWVNRYKRLFIMLTLLYISLLLFNLFVFQKSKLYFAINIFYFCCLIYFSTLGLIATIQIQKIKKKIEK